MIDLRRQQDESEEKFIWRLGCAYDSGELDLSWDEIGKIVNRQFREDETQYRDSSAYRKMYQYAKKMYLAGVFNDMTANQYADRLEKSRRELQKERIKLQTEKIEYNRWLREDARDEMLADKLANAIKAAQPIEFPQPLVNTSAVRKDKTGILAFGDAHYGCEYTIRGLRGEIINEYSPEVFENRMQGLLRQTVDIVRKEGLSEIRVYELGDSTDGLLRVGQLMKLRYGVIEQSVRYANYLANWLNELSKYVVVKFQMVFGNHTELRFFNQKKGSFKDENTGMYIRELIRAKLDGNPNFLFEQNPSGLIFDEVEGYNVLGIHGEVKNMEQTLKDFSVTYGVNIDILVGGHKHHLDEETIGIDKEVINVPSIIGVDDFAISLNKTSRPGASFLIIKEGSGLTEEYRIKL